MSQEKTIREMLGGYQSEVLREDLSPMRASKILAEMSALYGNVLDAIKNTEIAYHRILLKHYEEEKTANRARIKSEVSQEYSDKEDARNTAKVMLEMIRSLKYFLKEKEIEMRAGSNF